MFGITSRGVKRIAIAVSVVVVGIIVGVLLLALVYMIPSWRVDYNIGESLWTLCEERAYPVIKSGDMLDNFTDSIMLNIIYNKEESFAEDMLLSCFISDDQHYAADTLFDYIKQNGTGDFTIVDYGRYWHGYQVFLTPLFLLFNITQIRTLNMVVQLLLVLLFSVILGSKNRTEMIMPFAAAYLALSPIALFYSFQFSSTFYIMMLFLIVVALKYERWSVTKLCVVFEITGILEAYLDFLTYPVASLGIPLIFFFAMDAATIKTFVQRLKELVLICASWFLGYIGMWTGKWVLATAFTDNNIIAEAFTAIKIRSSTSQGTNEFTYADTLLDNLYYLTGTNNGLFNIIFVFMLLACLVLLLCKKRTAVQTKLPAVAIICVCCIIPFGWYLLTINHSNIHSWFTYRELVITVYGLMTIAYLSLYRKPKQTARASESETAG